MLPVQALQEREDYFIFLVNVTFLPNMNLQEIEHTVRIFKHKIIDSSTF